MESSLSVHKYTIDWNAKTTTKHFLVIFSMIFYQLHQKELSINFIMKEQICIKDLKKKSIPTAVLENKEELPYIAMGTGKITDEETLTKLLRKGLQLGYCRHIDTGRIYNNEIALGKAIKTVINQGRCKRQDLFIATKLHNHITLDPVVQLKQALALMQLDYVDLFYVHWPFLDMDEKGESFTHRSLEQCWSQFEQCVKKGYTKYLGLSNFNGQMINQLLTFCKIKPLALQVQINPYNPQHALVQTAQKHGIHIFAYSPLGKGSSYIKKQFNLLQEPIIKDLSAKYEKSVGQIILKSSLYRNIGVIPKTCNIDRLEENCKSGQIEISQSDFNKIQSIGKRNRIFNGVFKHICAFDY